MASDEGPLKPGILEDRFARVGLANSRSLLQSADALAAIKQFGHGLALVSLAFEELETAHAYRLVADGIATFDPKEAHVLQFIDKRALLQHAPKLKLIGERMLTFFYMRKTAKVVREAWDRRPTPDEVSFVMLGGDPVFSPKVKQVLDSPEVVREGRGIKDDIHRLVSLKNRGLYVFEEGRGVSAPAEITEAEFRHYRELADQLMQVMEETTENGFPYPIAESMRQAYAAYRRTHKRLEGPLNPKRIGDEDKTRSDYDYDPLADLGDMDTEGDSSPPN